MAQDEFIIWGQKYVTVNKWHTLAYAWNLQFMCTFLVLDGDGFAYNEHEMCTAAKHKVSRALLLSHDPCEIRQRLVPMKWVSLESDELLIIVLVDTRCVCVCVCFFPLWICVCVCVMWGNFKNRYRFFPRASLKLIVPREMCLSLIFIKLWLLSETDIIIYVIISPLTLDRVWIHSYIKYWIRCLLDISKGTHGWSVETTTRINVYNCKL